MKINDKRKIEKKINTSMIEKKKGRNNKERKEI